jgi:hypothetical protein
VVGSPTVGAATRVTKFEIGTGPALVAIRSWSSSDIVRCSRGRRRVMSTASSAPVGRNSDSFSPPVTIRTIAPIAPGVMP